MSNLSDNPSQDKQQKFNWATNIGRLAYLESRLGDFEKVVTEASEPLVYNDSPVFRYKEEVSGSKIFVLEIPVEWKREMIGDHFKIGGAVVIAQIQEKLNDPEEVKKYYEFVRQNSNYFGDTSTAYDMVIVGPQLETGFRIVMVLFPKQ